MALFEAQHVHKRFGDQVVLEEINLVFEEGKLNGIMGPNGAGKTTCFNVLTGRYKPNRGKVIFNGEDVTGQPPRVIARKGISRSFQIMNLFDEYSVIENILIALPEVRDNGFNTTKSVLGDSGAMDKAELVLARIGLTGLEWENSQSLSYGNRRALEIGVALATEPKLLFLDEPTAGMGAEATARLADLILELKTDHTIVIIEHDMRFLFELADQISVIHWGQVITQGTPEELQENNWVRASVLGEIGSAV